MNSSNYIKDETFPPQIIAKFNQLQKEEKSIPFTISDPKKFDFRNVHRINKYLNCTKKDLLWYIFHPIAKSSFGPCSSENLEEMYSGGMVDGQSEIRFIDVYNLKNKMPFTFFKLKELEDIKFIDEIELSSLVTNLVMIKDGGKFKNENNSNRTKNKNKLRKTSSIGNIADKNNETETHKEIKDINTNASNAQKENFKLKNEKRDLNSLLERVLNNDINQKEENKKSQNNKSGKLYQNLFCILIYIICYFYLIYTLSS